MDAPDNAPHDARTVGSIAALAFVVASLSHEALGHGGVAYLVGARHIVLSYTYLSTDIQHRALSAAGPLANLGEGLVAFGLARTLRRRAATTYFLFLLAAFNLLVAAAYLLYSGVSDTGDLAVVVAELPHLRLLRLGMDLLGLVLYGAVLLALRSVLRRFHAPRPPLTATAYVVALGLNSAAGLLNPLGLRYFLLSALPAAAAANAGLLALPGMANRRLPEGALLRVERSYPWVLAGLLAAAFFVFVVGPGLALR